MRRVLSVVSAVVLAMGCAGSYDAYRPDLSSIDELNKTSYDEIAVGKLAEKRDDLADITWWSEPAYEEQTKSELAYVTQVLEKRLTAIGDRALAESTRNPFKAAADVAWMRDADDKVVPPHHKTRILSVMELGAAAHDRRAQELGDAYPLARRFHIASAMLLRRKGDLPAEPALLVEFERSQQPGISWRVNIKGMPCNELVPELGKLGASTLTERVIDITFDVTQCKIASTEQATTESFEWNEEVTIGRQWIVTHTEKFCDASKIEDAREWCAREGDRAVCAKQTVPVGYDDRGCMIVPDVGEWRPIVRTDPKKGSRPVQKRRVSVALVAPWTATYKGKTITGTFDANDFEEVVTAPALGPHPEKRATLRTASQMLSDKVPKAIAKTRTEIAVVAAEDVAADEARRKAVANTANLGANEAEEAECKHALRGGALSEDFVKRYALVSGFSVAGALTRSIKDGRFSP